VKLSVSGEQERETKQFGTMVTLIFYFKKNGYSDLDRPRAGPDVHGRCPSRAAGAQLRRDTRRARSWSGRARRQHVAGGGDQALGGGCRLAGGEQLHVPFRGMLATKMCNCTPSVQK